MKTLLIYALNPEAGFIKQHFPRASKKISEPGMELLELNADYDMLRTGIGLQRTQSALAHIQNPDSYELLIQFGVSGSLSDELPVHSLINAYRFTALDAPLIELPAIENLTLPGMKNSSFYSSQEVIADEDSRALALAHGAQAVDMESYAVAEFCQTNQLSLLALRIISDRAGESTPEQFRAHFKTASAILQKYILKHILKIETA